ncbi:MAG: hypothetical protein C4518_06995 [Desulfobacteraceae bacterium]|nr:MAG: hypothetical protein C4518_06995 [Desulfobacteraceae bacterium]
MTFGGIYLNVTLQIQFGICLYLSFSRLLDFWLLCKKYNINYYIRQDFYTGISTKSKPHEECWN